MSPFMIFAVFDVLVSTFSR